MRKQVAILEKNGSCVLVMSCKLVDDKKHNELLNQMSANEQERGELLSKILNDIDELKEENENLKREIRILKGEEEIEIVEENE